jgi:hypothetical protein
MLPYTGITTSLVSSTLGHGSNDIGTLCSSNKINKWSKYKPVRNTTGTGNYWKATDGNCGLNIPSTNSITGIINYVTSGTTWNYLQPQGGSTSPYRLGDFRNYNHTAESPIAVDVPLESYISAGSTQVSMFYNEDTYTVTLTDIDSIKNTYMGAYLVSTNGSTGARMITATSPVISGVTYVDVPISDLNAGNYYIYPLLSDTVNTSTLSIPGGIIYYPLDSVTRSSITIKSTSSNISVIITTSWYNDDHNTNQIIYTIEITNNSASSTTLTNCYTFVKFFDHDLTDNIVLGETQTSRGNITVSGNSTYTINGSATAYYDDSPNGYNVWFSSLSPNIQQFEYVFDPFIQ